MTFKPTLLHDIFFNPQMRFNVENITNGRLFLYTLMVLMLKLIYNSNNVTQRKNIAWFQNIL